MPDPLPESGFETGSSTTAPHLKDDYDNAWFLAAYADQLTQSPSLLAACRQTFFHKGRCSTSCSCWPGLGMPRILSDSLRPISKAFAELGR